MAGAARGCAAGSDQVGATNVDSGHIKWSETVDPSAVQGIPGVVSENSRPFLLSRVKQMFQLSLPPVARSVKRRCVWVLQLQRCEGIRRGRVSAWGDAARVPKPHQVAWRRVRRWRWHEG
jgi:hypothetical protein